MSDSPLVHLIMPVLVRYCQALEDETIVYCFPDPNYVWQWYKGPMTEERMRKGLKDLDAYLNAPAQHGWAEQTHKEKFDTGPDLARLPDAAMLALFQELDQLFAEAAHTTQKAPQTKKAS